MQPIIVKSYNIFIQSEQTLRSHLTLGLAADETVMHLYRKAEIPALKVCKIILPQTVP